MPSATVAAEVLDVANPLSYAARDIAGFARQIAKFSNDRAVS